MMISSVSGTSAVRKECFNSYLVLGGEKAKSKSLEVYSPPSKPLPVRPDEKPRFENVRISIF